MRQAVFFGVSAIALCLLGCGGGQRSPGASPSQSSSGAEEGVPNTTVRASGQTSASAVLGPPGGTLELASGVRIEIPPGAVEGAQEFVLKEAARTTAFGNSEKERAVGPTFIFAPGVNAPDGRSIRVSIPLASYPEGWGDVSIAFEYPVGEMVGAEDAEHTRWQYEDAKLSGGRAVAELPAVNGYRLQFVLSNLEAQ